MGSPEPSIIEIGEKYGADIRAIARTGKGELPLDASLGSALKIADIRETWLEHIGKGGPVMFPILLMAFAALCVAAYKWLQLSRVQVAHPEDLQKILESLHRNDKPKALAHANSIRGPAGEMLAAAVNNAHHQPEMIEEVLYEKMLKSRPQMERLLPFLALTATAEPMLGLLGTVTGMINTFKMITVFGSGDPKLLSTGISEALITTEYGLIIAVPTLLVHAVLSRKVRGVIASMERNAVGFINGLTEKK
jgi:biopolymer transport protein ExbB